MVKPVALWSGLVKADAEGKATVTFDVPQYHEEIACDGRCCIQRKDGACGTRCHRERSVGSTDDTSTLPYGRRTWLKFLCLSPI